jgi:hypothetical protein
MHSYDSLREYVVGTGAALVEEHLHPESFGSAYCLFRGAAGGRFRLVWDGKEACGFLEANSGGGEWKLDGPIVRGGLGAKFSNLPEFLATAKELSSGKGKT